MHREGRAELWATQVRWADSTKLIVNCTSGTWVHRLPRRGRFRGEAIGSVHAQHLLEDPGVVIQGNRVLHLRYRVRR